MAKRLLTGIQSTGVPHLGNILGAILPAVQLSNQSGFDSFLFIADMHSITQIKNAETLKNNTLSTAATWLAMGLNPNNTTFYKQSAIPQVTELAWYLSAFFPYQRLTLAHSFKDKSDRLKDVNSALFNYPMLMAADILLYDAELIPVGKDQLQHIEFTRDVASRFNNAMEDFFVLPEAYMHEETKLVLGQDGYKMSKSKGNTINIFQNDKSLRKEIMKISTDSKSVEEPKDPNSDIVFSLYSMLAGENQVEELRKKYINGGYGYGSAKQELFDLVASGFEEERRLYEDLITNEQHIQKVLHLGAEKASDIASKKLIEIRRLLGLG